MDRGTPAGRRLTGRSVSDIIIVDTSILVDVLGVPKKSNKRDETLYAMRQHIERGDILILPAATVLEAGNHIGQIRDGRQARACANELKDVVRQSVEGVPWQLAPLPEDSRQFASLLEDLPDHAMRGVGFGDLTIIRVWNDACRQFPKRRVFIWSLDAHLKAYDQAAS